MEAIDVLALQNAQPLREIEIGGRLYPLGQLGAVGLGDVAAHGERILEHERSGTPLAPEDRDPSRCLRHLLYAGDANFSWAAVKHQITSAHCALAAQEFMRQAVVCALLPDRMGGQS